MILDPCCPTVLTPSGPTSTSSTHPAYLTPRDKTPTCLRIVAGTEGHLSVDGESKCSVIINVKDGSQIEMAFNKFKVIVS